MLAHLLSIYLPESLRVRMLLRWRSEDIFWLIIGVLLILVVREGLVKCWWLRISALVMWLDSHSSTYWWRLHIPNIGIVESWCSGALTINENHRHVLVTLSHSRAVSSIGEISTQGTNAMKRRSALPIIYIYISLILLLTLYLRSWSIKSIVFWNLLLINHACLLIV